MRILQVKTLHKYLGYALLIISQTTILTGVITYNTEATGSTDSTLGSINLGIFILVWVTLELGH